MEDVGGMVQKSTFEKGELQKLARVSVMADYLSVFGNTICAPYQELGQWLIIPPIE